VERRCYLHFRLFSNPIGLTPNLLTEKTKNLFCVLSTGPCETRILNFYSPRVSFLLHSALGRYSTFLVRSLWCFSHSLIRTSIHSLSSYTHPQSKVLVGKAGNLQTNKSCRTKDIALAVKSLIYIKSDKANPLLLPIQKTLLLPWLKETIRD
jgi:hypothetical protein